MVRLAWPTSSPPPFLCFSKGDDDGARRSKICEDSWFMLELNPMQILCSRTTFRLECVLLHRKVGRLYHGRHQRLHNLKSDNTFFRPCLHHHRRHENIIRINPIVGVMQNINNHKKKESINPNIPILNLPHAIRPDSNLHQILTGFKSIHI